ncbi:uncharacterized protein BYT42DRAFT_544799 [Radiomyces spectabilis]|uniref:uncharacterized protein n=1 Tax=Radiomyces spectabilis TaxID=64574 RepID=UPI0022209B1F|nr:uncharacterized protein BYT42DRAFT_544799 [Radiomyces spectabilis]KAI8384993.1 hypothetical protein BYT42DRAFT_544799 [Radiomyces spectabilis]
MPPIAVSMGLPVTGHADSEYFLCPVCPDPVKGTYFTSRSLAQHCTKKHRIKCTVVWHCYDCPRTFGSRSDFVQHPCVRNFFEPHALRVPPLHRPGPGNLPIDDFPAPTTSTSFSCPVCQRLYNNPSRLQEHYTTTHHNYLRSDWDLPTLL